MMSFCALAWASRQKTGKLAAKAALLALANYANELGEAYPSTAAVAEFGEMNLKTASAALDHLERLGLIVDTGKRTGRSLQIKVFRLPLESHPKTGGSQKREAPKFSARATQKRGTDTIREPILQTSSVSARGAGKGQRLPDGWEPSPLDPGSVSGKIAAAWAPDRYERELSKFSDHWAAKSGKAALSSNWQATWRNWVVKSDEFDQQRNGNSAGPSAAVAQAQKIMARRS